MLHVGDERNFSAGLHENRVAQSKQMGSNEETLAYVELKLLFFARYMALI